MYCTDIVLKEVIGSFYLEVECIFAIPGQYPWHHRTSPGLTNTNTTDTGTQLEGRAQHDIGGGTGRFT